MLKQISTTIYKEPIYYLTSKGDENYCVDITGKVNKYTFNQKTGEINLLDLDQSICCGLDELWKCSEDECLNNLYDLQNIIVDGYRINLLKNTVNESLSWVNFSDEIQSIISYNGIVAEEQFNGKYQLTFQERTDRELSLDDKFKANRDMQLSEDGKIAMAIIKAYTFKDISNRYIL